MCGAQTLASAHIYLITGGGGGGGVGGGWGGGVHPDYFVKLDFEIAVDQQTSLRSQTSEFGR